MQFSRNVNLLSLSAFVFLLLLNSCGGSKDNILTPRTQNNAPTASDLALNCAALGSVTSSITASDSDGDSLTYEVIVSPMHGVITLNGQTITYANTIIATEDSCIVRISDNRSGACDVAVRISIDTSTPSITPLLLMCARTGTITDTMKIQNNGSGMVTFTIVKMPSYGTLTVDSLKVTYTNTLPSEENKGEAPVTEYFKVPDRNPSIK